MKKRFLFLLGLAVLLVSGLLGGSALASTPVEVKLTEDTVFDETAVISEDTVYDLNGCTVSLRSQSEGEGQATGSVFRVKNGATLTVQDSSAAKSGKITGGRALGVPLDGFVNFGGGEYLGSVCGGGIYVEKGAALVLTGGSVTGNRAKQGGGVFLESGAALKVSGKASVSGNYRGAEGETADNVWLPRDSSDKQDCVVVDAALDSGAVIGVTTAVVVGKDEIAVSSGLKDRGSEANFTSDEGRFVYLNDAGEAVFTTLGKTDSTAPSTKELTYNGAAQELVTAGTATGGVMQYVLGADGTTAPTSGWDAAIPTGTDVGTYYVWYKVAGDSDHTDSDPDCVTAEIGKRAATVTANAQTVDLNGSIQTGTSYAALTGAVSGHTLSAVTLTGSSTANATTSGAITPSAAAVKDNGGNDVTANYEISYVNGVLTVSQGASSADAPTAKELTYSGAAQELVTAGTATGGAMQYAVGADGTTAPTSGWDTAIPTGTNAGPYYVWYKVVGDSDHTNTVPACITVEIGKKAATVKANAQTVDLNGTIDTAISNAVLTGALSRHTLSAVTLTGSGTANATTSGAITPSAAVIKDSGGNDVTANYAITYVDGVLTVSALTTYTVTVTNGSGGGNYAAGAKVTITADDPATGKQFKGWTGADGLAFTSGSATSATAVFTMPANAVTVTATYEDIPSETPSVYTVTVNGGTGGGSYAAGDRVTITANEPETGKQFKGWTGADGLAFISGDASTATVVFTMPAKTVTVTAAYEDIPSTPSTTYAVTVNGGAGGGNYTAGDRVTITANTPETGKQFKEWTGADGLAFTSGDATTATAVFTMPAHAVTLTATYEDIPSTPPTTYTVTVNGGTGGGSYAAGDSVTITANAPETGKQFKVWTGADGLAFTSGDATTATAVFTMPAHAVMVTATYEDIADNPYNHDNPDNPSNPNVIVTGLDTINGVQVPEGTTLIIPRDKVNQVQLGPNGETILPGGTTIQQTDGNGSPTSTATIPTDVESVIIPKDKLDNVTTDSEGNTALPGGSSIEIKDTDGNTTTITAPKGKPITMEPDGTAILPGGTTIATKDENGSPIGASTIPADVENVTIPKDKLDDVTTDSSGNITLPGAASIEIKDADGNTTTITAPENTFLTIEQNGTVNLPGGTLIMTRSSSGRLTGTSLIPDNVKTVTVPQGGLSGVKVDEQGHMNLPGGSSVTKRDGTTTSLPDGGSISDNGVISNPTKQTPVTPSGGGGGSRRGSGKSTSAVNPRPADSTQAVNPQPTDSTNASNQSDQTGSYTTNNPAPPNVTGVDQLLITETHPAYIGGFSDGSFRPNDNITRAQAATMFFRLLKNPNVTRTTSFSDMNGNEWYAEAVYTLSSLGIIQGYSDGSFHGNDKISRAAFAAIATRLAKANGVNVTGISFNDVPATHWAGGTIAQASYYGWIGGYTDGSFHPGEPITRAAVTAVINRMLGRSADTAFIAAHSGEMKRFSDVQDTGAWYYYNVAEAANGHGFTIVDGKETWSGVTG